jgi:hypothetical protein|tara:strand:- start:1613 stop:1768 length:156 start_codon:yes stop_codon:yes gene_type:complete
MVILGVDKEEITGSYKIGFPKEMSKEEINWIKEHLFRFLERHSCTIEKKDV